MAFKLSLIADFKDFLKGTKDVEKSMDDLADSLDELARDTAQDADKAADALTREFKDAFDEVKTEAKTAGKKLGDDIQDGTRRAGEGMDDFKQEANQSARETMASFDGSADSIGDMFQEVAANAFSGFGPAGTVAGLAAAAGIGLVMKSLEDASEAAEESRERISDVAKGLAEVDGEVDKLDWSDKLKELLYGPVAGSDQSWIEKYGKGLKLLGISSEVFTRAMMGEKDAQEQLNAARDRAIAAQNQFSQEGAGNIDQINATTGAITQQNTEVNKGKQIFTDGEGALGDYSEAQKRATEAAEEFSESLTDNLSVADEGLDKFVHKGKLSIKEWSEELERRATQNTTVKNFAVNISPELSPEALQSFAELPIETQSQIAEAYKNADGKGKKKIVANLEAEAKVDSIKINTDEAQADANSQPIEVPVTVNTAAIAPGTQKAASEGQAEANRSDNAIEFKTKIDRAELQRQVNRAAASITPPVIWAKVKVKNEVP